MFIIGVDDREDESIGALQDMMRHPQSSRKPILIVLNNKNNSELDDVEFSNRANLQEIADSQQQMVFITHINTYDGSLNNVKAPVPFLIRYRKNRTALLEQFSCFIDKIIEHYVYLSEGVRAAELALKLKQNEDREARKLKMMQDQHDQRAADVALLEGRATAQLSSGRLSIANHVNEVKHDSNLITTEPTPEDPIPEIPTIGSFHPPEQILEQPEPEEVIYAEPHKVLDYSSIHNDEMIINPSYIEHSDSNKLSAVSKDYPESGRSQRRVSISGKSRTNKITPVNEGTIYKEGDPGPNLDIFTVSHEAGKIEYDPELAKSKKLRYIRRMDRIAKNTTLKLSNEVTPTPDNVSIKSLGLSHI
ncbi:hypothetical protein WR25_10519 [Diploscapter pachys]|uniref:Uncharacterized protein n=1 Tax=Diploscapter pachys TaxID=2018661 RepID=A0A2A2JYL9_9BILA|nr:hypothetical protein WR25_10519 [Diploscapter pachys]